MTLQELIDGLSKLDPATIAPRGFHNPHSWRGVYAELAFEPTDGPVTVGEMLATAQSALGQTYEGWKGGDFTMSAHTDVHIDYEGQYGGSDMLELWFSALTVLSAPAPIGKEEGSPAQIAGYHSVELADISAIITWLHSQNKPMGELLRRFFTDARQGKAITEYNDVSPLAAPAAGASPVGGPAGAESLEVLGLRNKIKDLEQAIGLERIHSEHVSAHLAQCEKALEESHAREMARAAAPSLLGGGVATDLWISVSDKLPLLNQEVLAILTSGSQVVVGFEGTCWVTGLGTEYPMQGSPKQYTVTHWQPLPELPAAAPTQVAIGGSGQQ